MVTAEKAGRDLDVQHDDPDVQLMLRVRDGEDGDDWDAFNSLMERYQARAIGIITYLMGNNLQSEDLVQEVFLRVWKASKTYVPSAKFSTWFFTIVNNVVSNARRKIARKG